jgi:centromeric protein E
LIDLAGSEKASTQDIRRKEGAYINKSLLTLGTVISHLTKPKTATPVDGTPGGSSHIPFRDSKLTRLLQPSLSGGGYIVVLATICDGQKFSAETLSTLQFARRAKKIPAKAVQAASIAMDGLGDPELRARLAECKAEIEDLKSQLSQEKARKGNEAELNELQVQRENLNNRIERLSVLAVASGDSRNPLLQQVPALSFIIY